MKNTITRFSASVLTAIFAVCMLAACGDSGSSADDSGTGENFKDPDGGSDKPGDDAGKSDASQVFVFGSDYQAGELRWVADGKLSKESLAFYQDSRLVAVGGDMLVLEGNGNVALVDGEEHEVLWEISIDKAGNPKDAVLLRDSTAWIALEGTSAFVKISLADGKLLKTVSTDKFASEGASSSYLTDFEVSGDTLFALFQRRVYDAEAFITSFPKPGLVAMYKLNDGALLDTIPLKTKNPTAMQFVDGRLCVATMGEYNDAWGTDADANRGIEVVNVAKRKSAVAVGGDVLGGGVYGFVADASAGVAYAAVYKGFGNVPVAKVDVDAALDCEDDDCVAASVTVLDSVVDAEGSLAFDATAGLLYIGDRDGSGAAVLVYDGDGVSRLETSTKDVLPPYGLAVAVQ